MASKQEKFKKQLTYGNLYCPIHDKMKMTFSGNSEPTCLQCVLDKNRENAESRTWTKEQRDIVMRMPWEAYAEYIKKELKK